MERSIHVLGNAKVIIKRIVIVIIMIQMMITVSAVTGIILNRPFPTVGIDVIPVNIAGAGIRADISARIGGRKTRYRVITACVRIVPQVAVAVSDIRIAGRATQGVKLVNLRGKDSIAAIS